MNILIIKLAAIGDVLMSTTMLSAIEEKYPGSHITWVCGQTVRPILEVYPIDELMSIDEKALLTGSQWDKMSQILSLWKRLAGRHYDLVVLAHSDARYRLLTWGIQGRRVVQFNAIGNHKIPVPGRYHGDEYARMILEVDDYAMEASYPPALPRDVSGLYPLVKKEGKPIIVLSPGGAKNTMRDDGCRRWPVEHYVSLAKKLLTQGYELVLTGATSDAWVEPYFEGLPLLNLVGQTNLLETLSVFTQADLLITHDSGPLHMAVVSRVPIIALFGPTMPQEKLPQADWIHVLWNPSKLPCCPCYDGKNYAPCDYNQCLEDIGPDTVVDLAKTLVGDS